MKQHGQNQHDRRRKIYTLTFPANLADDVVVRWVHSISGTLRPRMFGVGGAPSIVFELWATDRGITYMLHVPREHADYVVGQLRVTIPGIVVTPVDQPLEYKWSSVVEVGEKNPDRALRIMDAGTLAGSLLGSVQALRPGEAVLMQWVVAPTKPREGVHEPEQTIRVGSGTVSRILEHAIGAGKTPRHVIAEQRTKLAEANVSAILRVGTRAKTDKRANHLLRNVRGAMASVNGPGNWFVTTNIPNGMVHDRIARATAPTMWPARLSASELSGLIAWPIGNPNVAGLPFGRTRHMPATEATPRVGRVIGRSNWPGNERPIAISPEDSCKHMYVVGPTGTGKSTLLANLFAQDVASGSGAVLIEKEGSLFYAALDQIPKDRIKDVVVLNLADHAYPVGLNILNEGNPRYVVDNLVELFEHMYGDTKNVWTHEVLTFGLLTLTSVPGAAFTDLAVLLSPSNDTQTAWRKQLIDSVTDPDVADFWRRFFKRSVQEQERYIQPVLSRVWQLSRTGVKNVIGQSKSSFSMRDVLEGKKILLVNLAASDIGEKAANLTGTLIINALWQAARTSNHTDPVQLTLDEFQDFLRLPVGMEDMLAKARKYRLAMTLAHQNLDQISDKGIRSGLLTNARSKVVFQLGPDDAAVFARYFGPGVEPHDITGLPSREIILQLAQGGSTSGPMTAMTNPPPRSLGNAHQVIAASQTTYGRPVAQVEADIHARRTPPKTQAKRQPARGGTQWKSTQP